MGRADSTTLVPPPCTVMASGRLPSDHMASVTQERPPSSQTYWELFLAGTQ